MDDVYQGGSDVLSDLDQLVEHLDAVRARAAAAFADEQFFFARAVGLVERRERECAARAEQGAKVSASQLAMRELYAELGAALNLSELQVKARVDQAYRFMTLFPETMLEAGDGRLSPQHAKAILDVGTDIGDPGVRGEFERLAIDIARELTAAQLLVALDALVDRLDPEGTQDRIREAKARHGIRKRTLPYGTSQLIITGPTTEIEGAHDRVTTIAGEIYADNHADIAAHAAGDAENATDGFVPDERTLGQVGADAALELLLTSAVTAQGETEERRAALSAIRATIHVTVPAATLTGVGTGGAMITGGGQIDDDSARRLAGGSDDWYRYFIDPATGVPVSVDRRRPCTAQKRLLQARDETCRFPGCRRPARTSDIDHTVAVVDGGPTALWNLAHLCERHHTLKHHTDWTVGQFPGGILRFTAPTGRRHTTRPPATVRFIPDRPPGTPPGRPGRAPAQDRHPAPF